MKLPIKQSILDMRPYQQGKSDLDGIENPIKLSSNELSYGPSPLAIDAFIAASSELNRYPDGGQTELRRAISDVFGLPVDNLICGNGSEELLQLLIRAFSCEGDEVLLSENGFVMCQVYISTQGATAVVAPEKDYKVDVDALLARVTARTRIVIIANPNNPTGTYLSRTEVERLHAGLPDDVLLVLDGAYAEFVVREDYESGENIVAKSDNVVMTRAFSKIYGLSALRIGWAYCPTDIIDILRRVRSPFSANAAAMAAAAAAVRDLEFTAMVIEKNESWLQRLRVEFTAIGIEVIESVSNFYLLRFPGGAGKNSKDAANHLQANGIIPRPVSDDGDNKYLRITVGSDEENQAVVTALQDYMNND
ncbi:MAG: histidinol-phosphate transaminase [Arenicella sp.]|nr:histidinol-phosphate transaminase [Arenicella sp.]